MDTGAEAAASIAHCSAVADSTNGMNRTNEYLLEVAQTVRAPRLPLVLNRRAACLRGWADC